MLLIQTIYGLFFALTLFSALMVVLAPHAIYSALYLVLTMLSIAGIFVLMNAQLAAVFQVIVYAGAIMVLFLFVIMLLNLGRSAPLNLRNRSVRWLGLALAVTFLLQMTAVLGHLRSNEYLFEEPRSVSIQEVGRLLTTHYVYAFEITSILLLVAVIGAVVLARRFLLQGTRLERLDT